MILTNFGGSPGTWGTFSSPLDAKLSPDGLVLQWNGHSKTFWTLTFELVGRNIATLYFKTETVAETAFRSSWFWSTWARFPGTWGIFSSPGDPKLTFDIFGLQWNAHSKTFWTLTFELLGRNIAPLHFKTERVASGSIVILTNFSSIYRNLGNIFPRDAKLTGDGLVFESEKQKNFFEGSLSGFWAQNIAPTLRLKE